MATIGFDSLTIEGQATFASPRTTADPHFIQNVGTATYTPSAAENITAVGFYCGPSAGDVEVGVYRLDTLAKVASATVTGVADSRCTTSLSTALPAIGVAYGCAWRIVSSVDMMLENFTSPNGGSRNTGLTGANALPSTFTDTGPSLSSEWAVFAITSAAADTTGPTYTDGPDVDAIADTTATIGGTLNETGTDAVVPTTAAAAQPSNATFDAAAVAVTAATPYSHNLTGLTPAQLTKFWSQGKDSAGTPNRTTTFVMGLTGHAGYERVTIVTPNPDTGERLESDPPLASDDIVEWGDIEGTGTVTIDDAGDVMRSPGVTGFWFYVGNLTDGWGAIGHHTFGSAAASGCWSITTLRRRRR